MNTKIKILLLFCLIGALVIFLAFNKTTIEKFTNPDKKNSNPDKKTKNPDDIVIDSLIMIQPSIKKCADKKGTATLISVDLSKVKQKSLIKCFTNGTFNLETQFQMPNTKTIMTGKNDIVAELYSENDGKGVLLGLIPNPSGTTYNYSAENMKAKSIVIKNRADFTLKELEKLEYVLPPLRWSCIKKGARWKPILRKELYGDVKEDTRSVSCDKEGRAYFTDKKLTFKPFQKAEDHY